MMYLKIIYILSLLIYDIKSCSKLETDTIEIIQNENLILKLNMTSDFFIDSCTFISDRINISLENGTHSNMNEDGINISFMNLKTYCLLQLFKIQDNYDMKWRIVAEYDNKNCTTKEFEIKYFYSSDLINKNIIPTKGATFTQYLLLDQELKECRVIIDDTNVILNVKDESAIIPKGFKLADRLQSVGRNKCGVKVNYVEKDDPVNYALYAIDVDDRSYKANFKFKLRDYNLDNMTVEVESGKSGYIPCNTSINDVFSDGYCTLYDPDGKKVVHNFRDCNLLIDITTKHLGNWKCVKNVFATMQDIELYINVKLLTPKLISQFVNRNFEYTVIGCKSRKMFNKLEYCRIASPNGKSYFIQQGAATDRITTLSLDLKNGVCSIEIKNPVRDDEKGMWKCYIDDESINVDVDASAIIKYKKYVKENTKLNEKLLIYCQVPYPSEYCFILSPNGTKYKPDNNYNPILGECAHSIDRVDQKDNGTWQCIFTRKPGEPMDIIKYDVLVADRMFYYKEIEVDAGDDATLLCSTDGIGLDYCMYISPDDNIYYIKDNQTSSTISYYGNGLSYGDCGIKIHKIQTKDTGRWRCVAKIRNGEENSMALFVTVSDTHFISDGPALATTLGVSFGIILIIGIGIGYYSYRRIKLRRQGLNVPETVAFHNENTSQNSDRERIDIPFVTVTHNNYDASGNVR